MTCHGVVKNGTVVLDEPATLPEGSRVIVLPVQPGVVDLPWRGIDAETARELRARLQTFAGDWDDPAMNVYDNYDAAKSAL